MKKIMVISLTLAMLVMGAFSVGAETGSIELAEGTLSVTTDQIGFNAITLDGTDQAATSEASTNNWTVTDARGSGAGWNVTISATDFSYGAGNVIDISDTDSEFKIQLLDSNVAVVSGNAKPVSQVTSLTPIPETSAGTPLKFLSAVVDTGMGVYSVNPNFELEIPADLHVGAGAYSSTVTITAASGP